MTLPQLDLRVAELICSRLCHDLISPISAINNGIELIAEVGDEARPDADALIADSARNANRRLRAFRYAYGLAGGDASLDDVRNVAISYFEGTKIVVDWPPLSVALPAGAGKVVLTLLMLTPDLVRGPAKVAVTASPHSVAVAFTGTNSKLEEDLAAALDGAVLSDNLDPRTAHAVLVAAQASRMGGKISHHETADTIHVNIEWPQ